MKNKLLFFLLISFLVSCGYQREDIASNPRNSDSDSTAVNTPAPKEKLEDIRLTYGNPVDILASEYVIIPVGGSSNARGKRSISSSDYNSKWGNQGYSYNLIFHHPKKDSSFLFSQNDRMHILNFQANLSQEQAGPYSQKFIFYDLRKKDYNLNGKIDDKDGSRLFVTDKKGANLTQLTPNNTDLYAWEIIKKSNIILATVRVDENDDKKFNKKDPLRLLRIDLEKLKKGRPLLNRETENKLKEQFYDIYLRDEE